MMNYQQETNHYQEGWQATNDEKPSAYRFLGVAALLGSLATIGALNIDEPWSVVLGWAGLATFVGLFSYALNSMGKFTFKGRSFLGIAILLGLSAVAGGCSSPEVGKYWTLLGMAMATLMGLMIGTVILMRAYSKISTFVVPFTEDLECTDEAGVPMWALASRFVSTEVWKPELEWDVDLDYEVNEYEFRYTLALARGWFQGTKVLLTQRPAEPGVIEVAIRRYARFSFIAAVIAATITGISIGLLLITTAERGSAFGFAILSLIPALVVFVVARFFAQVFCRCVGGTKAKDLRQLAVDIKQNLISEAAVSRIAKAVGVETNSIA